MRASELADILELVARAETALRCAPINSSEGRGEALGCLTGIRVRVLTAVESFEDTEGEAA